LPMATAISLKHGIPMIMRRKEVKDYGTKKTIEGMFTQGQRCIVIEDLVTSGSSVFETAAPLEHEGLIVEHIAVLIDREQGGRRAIEAKGYSLHAAFTVTELLQTLEALGKINASTAAAVKRFINANQVVQK